MAAALFSILYTIPIMQSHPTAHSTLAILAAVTFLWATEGIPIYATSYIVPVLAVWLGVGVDPKTHLRLSGSDRATSFAHAFMDPVVFVYLGCMTISATLMKLSIADRFSNFVFKHLPVRPALMLLVLMLVNLFMAAFISSATSTTILINLVTQIIRSLDPDDPFAKALLFGLCWSGNAGSMSTWIASPQNLMAVNALQSTWDSSLPLLQWMAFGFPISICVCIAEWAYLCLRFTPRRTVIAVVPHMTSFKRWSLPDTSACVITGTTVVLWSMERTFPEFLGNIGITSLIPVVAFFGSKILTVEDFHMIRWPTLCLMGGGLAIGEAMRASKLTEIFGVVMINGLKSVPLWPLLIMCLLVVAFFASLMNSTVAAAILYPLIGVIGDSRNHAPLFVCLSAIGVSGAQLFHMSTYANALVAAICKHERSRSQETTAETFLERFEFPLVGWPTIVAVILITASIGYGIGLAMGL
jgi:phosphate transporter